jgi:flagellar hook-length control protein FliK
MAELEATGDKSSSQEMLNLLADSLPNTVGESTAADLNPVSASIESLVTDAVQSQQTSLPQLQRAALQVTGIPEETMPERVTERAPIAIVKGEPEQTDLSSASLLAQATLGFMVTTLQPPKLEQQTALADPFVTPEEGENAVALPPVLSLLLQSEKKAQDLATIAEIESENIGWTLPPDGKVQPSSASLEITQSSVRDIALVTVSPLAIPHTEVTPSPVPLVTLEMPLELNQGGWGITLGQQLLWLVQHHTQRAKLKLNPPHLGPLEVHLSLEQQQSNVTFFSHDAMVREALESALPKLREMLDSQGIALHQANVSDQPLAYQQQGMDQQLANQKWGTKQRDESEIKLGDDQPLYRAVKVGIVDHYV